MSCQACTRKVLWAWLQNLTHLHPNQPPVFPCFQSHVHHRRWYRSTRLNTTYPKQLHTRRERPSEDDFVPFEHDSPGDPALIPRHSEPKPKPNYLVERVMREKHERIQSFKAQSLDPQSPKAEDTTRQSHNKIKAQNVNTRSPKAEEVTRQRRNKTEAQNLNTQSLKAEEVTRQRRDKIKAENLSTKSPKAEDVTRQSRDKIKASRDGKERPDGDAKVRRKLLHKQDSSTAPLVKPEPEPSSRNPNSEREPWQVQKDALKKKFGGAAWAPKKKLSPDAMDGIRKLHSQQPNLYTTPYLAKQFEVSPDVIRRILKSKWRPTEKEEEDRRRRWEKRGETIWTVKAELGLKPPKKWRQKGINSAEWKTKLALQRRAKPGARKAREEKVPSIASRIL